MTDKKRKQLGLLLSIILIALLLLSVVVLTGCVEKVVPPGNIIIPPQKPPADLPAPPVADTSLEIVYINMNDIITLSYSTDKPIILYRPVSRVGYTFLYWMAEDNTPILGDSINFSSDISKITFTAKWDKLTYTITYNANGGVYDKFSEVYDVETLVSLGTPTRKGYEFLGWHHSGNYIDSIHKGSFGNKELTANWKILTYDITYNNVDSSFNGMASYDITTNSFLLPMPSLDRREFLGWYNDSSFKGTPIATLAKGSFGNLSLFAKWSQPQYIINYQLNSGSASNLPAKYSRDDAEDIQLSSFLPQRTGYKFLGWYSHPDGLADYKVNYINKLDTRDYFLFASWKTADATDNVAYKLVCTAVNPDSTEQAHHTQCYFNITGRLNNISNKYHLADTHHSLPVKSLANSAFANIANATVILSKGITSIGAEVFMGSSNLELSLSAQLRSIGDRCFKNSKNLRTTIPASVGNNIGIETFYGSYNCVVDIENGVTAVPEKMFFLSVIDRITLPSSITTIGSLAFANMPYAPTAYKGATIRLGGNISSWGANTFKDSYIVKINMEKSQSNIPFHVVKDLSYIDNDNVKVHYLPPISLSSAQAQGITSQIYSLTMGFSNPRFTISFACSIVNSKDGLLGHYSYGNTPEQVCVKPTKDSLISGNFVINLKTIDTIIHEIRHYYQQLNCVGKIANITSDSISLPLRPTRAQIADWDLPYISGDTPESYPDYYHQPREEDARAWATNLTGYTPAHSTCRKCPIENNSHDIGKFYIQNPLIIPRRYAIMTL